MKNDYVFKRMFAKKGNEEYLKEFLSSLLRIKICEIEVEYDIALEKDIKEEKLGILDVKAKLNDGIEVDIEIQIKDYSNIIERTTFYATRMISSNLKVGEDYSKIKPVIVVAILNFDYFPFEEHITKTVTVADKRREYQINKYITYYYIELPKFRSKKLDAKDITSQWITFIDSENEDRIDEIMKNNEKIKKANEELEYLSGDAEVRRIAELRDKALRDLASARNYGYSQGKEEGKKERENEIAINLLSEGMDISVISKVTGLTKEEIEKLKNNV